LLGALNDLDCFHEPIALSPDMLVRPSDEYSGDSDLFGPLDVGDGIVADHPNAT
jgi:hypothetical protein